MVSEFKYACEEISKQTSSQNYKANFRILKIYIDIHKNHYKNTLKEEGISKVRFAYSP